MPEIRVSELRGSLKDFAKGKTARQLLDESRREEFLEDKKLEEMVQRYLEKQKLRHLDV